MSDTLRERITDLSQTCFELQEENRKLTKELMLVECERDAALAAAQYWEDVFKGTT